MPESTELRAYLDEVVARALAGRRSPGTAAATGEPEPPPATLKGRARRLLRRVYVPVAREEIVRQERNEARMVTESARTLAAIAGLEIEIEQLREQLNERSAPPDVSRPLEVEHEFDDLYLDFENRFRGSTGEITARLEPYLDDLGAVPDGGAPVLDLGCGRGEWLRLLAAHGVAAEGVDMNPEIADLCRADGLSVRVGDAFATVQSAAAESYGAITAFQLVEHMPVTEVASLAIQAARALRPGGILILETPNPTNLRVGAASFYRDPTHRRPMHPDLLSFLVERAGLTATLRFVNVSSDAAAIAAPDGTELPPWANNLVEELRWALYGPLDYAVVAYKPVD